MHESTGLTAAAPTAAAAADEFEISIAKRSDGGFGIKMDAENVVSKIIAGGALAVDGRVRVGDKILGVNDVNLSGALSLADALAQLDVSDGSIVRFRCLHVANAGTTSEKIAAKVLQEKQRRQEKVLAEKQSEEAKARAAANARKAATTQVAADSAAAMRTILKGSTYKMPELERLLQELDDHATRPTGGEKGSQRRAKALTVAPKSKRALSSAAVGSAKQQVAEPAIVDEVAAVEVQEVEAESVLFVHFIPPPLRAEGKKHLPWIVHTCNGDGCREIKHVTFLSVTGFSTFEGEPPEKAEGRCCPCAIANHHLRGYGSVRFEGDHAFVEDDGCTANVDGRAYMQEAKKASQHLHKATSALAKAKEENTALAQQVKALKAQLAAGGAVDVSC